MKDSFLSMARSLLKDPVPYGFHPIWWILCVLVFNGMAWCADPVRNVRAEQRGNQVVIFYDLEGKAERYEILARGSSDGGQSFGLSMKSLSGDLGGDVPPGRNKAIVWEALRDVKRLIGDEFVFEVTASEVRKPTFVARLPEKPRLEPALSGEAGTLIVNTHGDESQVFIIDRSKHWMAPIGTDSVWEHLGSTPYRNPVPAGEYWVRVVFKDKQETKPISIKPGKTSELTVTFQMLSPGGGGGGGR